MTRHEWSTEHIAPSLRAEFWRSVSQSAGTPITPCIPRPEGFQARLTTRAIGDLALNQVSVDAVHDVRHTLRDIACTGLPCLLVDMYLSGQGRVTQGAGEMLSRQGEPFVLDDRRTYHLAHREAMSMLVLVVPRAGIDLPDRAWSAAAARRLARGPALQILARQMRVLGAWPHRLGAQEAEPLSDLIAGTVQAVLQAATDGGTRAHGVERNLLRRKVQQLIARSYEDPAFGPAAAADELGLPVRLLHACLAREGTTFSCELLAYRLERAHGLLRFERLGIETLGAVARRCGFLTTAQFAHAFRRRFGVSPRRLLRAEWARMLAYECAATGAVRA
jgi:AraC-like DNA-binding protein